MSTTRRDFVRISGLALLVGVGGLTSACQDRTDVLQTPLAHPNLADRLIAVAVSLRGVHALGQDCLNRQSQDDLTEALIERLQVTRADSLGQALVASARVDFSTGRVYEFQDWLLSETECLLAALSVAVGGGTQEEADELVYRSFLTVKGWGPSRTDQGEVFNAQSDGSGAFWIRVDGEASAAVRVVLDGVPLATTVRGGLITAAVTPVDAQRIVSSPGQYPLELLDIARNWIQSVGALVVDPVTAMATLDDGRISTVFCQPAAWGPQQAVEGVPFNEQPGGESALWIQIECAPTDAVMLLSGQRLPTTVSDGLITALVARDINPPPGGHPVELISDAAGERFMLGLLEIRAG